MGVDEERIVYEEEEGGSSACELDLSGKASRVARRRS